MDSSYSYSNNPTTSTISDSYTSTQYFSSQYPQVAIQQSDKPPPHFRSATHYSVRKFPAAKKTITNKKLPIAPLPPKRQKIYKVEPADFKDVVQKLTGAAGELLRAPTVALPRLSLSPPPRSQPAVEKPLSEYLVMATEYENEKQEKLLIGSSFGGLMSSSPVGYSSSPSSLAWCSSMFMSSGSLAGLEPN